MFEITVWLNGVVVHNEKFYTLYSAENALASYMGIIMAWRNDANSIAWSVTGENTDNTGAWEHVQ